MKYALIYLSVGPIRILLEDIMSFLQTLFVIFFVLSSAFLEVSRGSASTMSSEKNISIKGSFNLTGIIKYQFQIFEPSLKSQAKTFQLASGLSLKITSPNDKLTALSAGKWFFVDNGDGIITGQVQGKLDRSQNSELLSKEMMILSSEIQWFPLNLEEASYTVEIEETDAPFIYVPSEMTSHCGVFCKRFQETRPQQELYLVLGNYTSYSKEVAGVNLGVALHQADEALAENYLQLLPEYISRYSQMIGKYPFREFWVIENFAETGYGMPGFTLLGKSVIRLPFLLKSSLPHEVLHNWLGNSLFVDYRKGNWCEGLTTHLADHYEQKITQQDASYRRNAILNYMNFVNDNLDFPLAEFQGRHSGSTQAIGYGKSMMVFQMIQDYLGEEIFYQRLQKIFQQNYFKKIGFEEFVQGLFDNKESDYNHWLPWVKQKGLVDIKASVSCQKGKRVLNIQSTPQDLFYKMEIVLQTPDAVETRSLELVKGTTSFEIADKVTSLQVDPSFKVFRKLSEGEKPLALSEIFGKKLVYVVVEESLHGEFELWKQGIQSAFPISFEVLNKEEAKRKTSKEIVIYFSYSKPEIFNSLESLERAKIILQEEQLKIDSQHFSNLGHAWMILSKDPQGQTLAWVKPQRDMDSMAWGKQLTHYTQMGVLVFKDRKNIYKNTFASGKSDLEVNLSRCPN